MLYCKSDTIVFSNCTTACKSILKMKVPSALSCNFYIYTIRARSTFIAVLGKCNTAICINMSSSHISFNAISHARIVYTLFSFMRSHTADHNFALCLKTLIISWHCSLQRKVFFFFFGWLELFKWLHDAHREDFMRGVHYIRGFTFWIKDAAAGNWIERRSSGFASIKGPKWKNRLICSFGKKKITRWPNKEKKICALFLIV